MKKILNKKELTYIGATKYTSPNPNVIESRIAEYLNGAEHLYQPQVQDVRGSLVIDRCGYTSKGEAIKAIDNYTIQ